LFQNLQAQLRKIEHVRSLGDPQLSLPEQATCAVFQCNPGMSSVIVVGTQTSDSKPTPLFITIGSTKASNAFTRQRHWSPETHPIEFSVDLRLAVSLLAKRRLRRAGHISARRPTPTIKISLFSSHHLS
jgi:hypothetical protein